MKTYHITVYGHVQGVGFRYFTLEKARALHISGWVRNTLAGTVEIKASGHNDSMEQFIEILKRGPSFSRVSKVDVVETAPLEEEEGKTFRIL